MQKKTQNTTLKSIIIGTNGIVFAILLLEIIFMYVPQSHGNGTSLASKVWRYYYWYPATRGHRIENEVHPKANHSILLLGDSFGAGHGLKNGHDRFGRLIEKKMGNSWKLIDLSFCGANTQSEIDTLLKANLKPDIAILQYYINDIEHVITPPIRLRETKPYEWLIQKSYLINFIYHQFPQTSNTHYKEKLKHAYSSQNIVQKHIESISVLTNHFKTQHIPLIVVLIPHLALDESKQWLNPIKRHLQYSNIMYVDLANDIHSIPIDKRVINKVDSHASPIIHSIIADRVHALIQKVPRGTQP